MPSMNIEPGNLIAVSGNEYVVLRRLDDGFEVRSTCKSAYVETFSDSELENVNAEGMLRIQPAAETASPEVALELRMRPFVVPLRSEETMPVDDMMRAAAELYVYGRRAPVSAVYRELCNRIAAANDAAVASARLQCPSLRTFHRFIQRYVTTDVLRAARGTHAARGVLRGDHAS